MMRSMYSGVAGLKVHQTKMDVIGNNISNVNTIGFKSSTVNFSDVLYQTTQSASGPNAQTGTSGRNAMQIGLGAGVASITASMTTSGASERTDNPLDLMIEGDSFFIVNNGGANYFTKAGSFNIDAAGTLCTASGAKVMGWQVDPNDPTKTIADTVSPLAIMSPENLYAEPEATTNVNITGNIDSKDTQLASTNPKGVPTNFSFYDKMGNMYTANLKITQAEDATNQYNVVVTDITDSTGQSIFVKKGVPDPTTGAIEYGESSITEFNFGGISYSVESIDTTDGKVKLSNEPTVLTFSPSNGTFLGIGEDNTATSKSVALSLKADASDLASPFSDVDVDFSSITMFATSGSCSLESAKGSLTGLGAGKPVGNMKGISIDKSGKIFGSYTNGDSKLLGQIAVANFANPAGLEAVGNSMFAATQNSGEFDGIGQDPTQGGGGIKTGVLEMSNVDLSQQFTDMITTQRGFQANSRIITTSDTLLEELINLKR